MKRRDRLRARMHLAALVALCAGVFAVAGAGPSSAQVNTVVGSATGFFSNVTLFGQCVPPEGCVRGPAPTVTLPAEGSAAPITATAPEGSAIYGPATVFTSGPLEVSTEGTTGASGSVTSSTEITTVNTSGNENFTASAVASTCTASEAETTGSVTITDGQLRTDSGETGDDDVVDPGEPGEHEPVDVDVPADPPPNTVIEGHLHLPNNITDTFRWVFNEQIENPDGSLTVRVAHQYLSGPSAVGDLIIGEATCGVNPTVVTTTTTADDGGQPTTTIRTGPPLVRTGSENDMMIALAAMALTLGGLLVMGAKGLPGPSATPPESADPSRRPPPPD